MSQTYIGPIATNSGASISRGGLIYPIEALNTFQNNWTIKACVTQKSDIKLWSSQRGQGKLFSATLMDQTGEIHATAFNEVVDEHYDKLEEGKVYYISKARIKPARKKFSHNDYEMGIERHTIIEECVDGNNAPMIKYNFTKLSDLETLPKDSTCDVIAIVKEAGPLEEVISKTTNKPVTKRDLTVVDKSLYSVRMTVWGRQAEAFAADDFPVIAFKTVRVGDFGGRNLSVLTSSYMTVSPDIPEAHLLRGWYDNIGAEKSFQSHSNLASSGDHHRNEMRHIIDVKESQLGSSEPEFFSIRATVLYIKDESVAYPACPTQGCNKKVTGTDGRWFCEICDETFERPEYRYIMFIAVADWSSHIWLQGYNNVGLAVFGKSADEVMGIKEHDVSEYRALLAQLAGKTFDFNCRAKQETWNGQTRLRYSISRISKMDYHEEAKRLCDLLKISDRSV